MEFSDYLTPGLNDQGFLFQKACLEYIESNRFDSSSHVIWNLEKKVQNHEFPKELEKILKKYATTEETTRITLAKIKEND